MDKAQLIQELREQGFSKEIIEAFSNVKREKFLPEELKDYAYEDAALAIGFNQTISQPYTIAVMLSLLELKEGQKVLEIGSGSGYVLALISEIVGKEGRVYGVEIVKQLAEKSKKSLEKYKNVEIYNRNGLYGLAEKAPFDRILISAGYKEIPKRLIPFQLKDRGIIVAPVGSEDSKSIMQYQKSWNKLHLKKKVPGFAFVPLVEK